MCVSKEKPLDSVMSPGVPAFSPEKTAMAEPLSANQVMFLHLHSIIKSISFYANRGFQVLRPMLGCVCVRAARS